MSRETFDTPLFTYFHCWFKHARHIQVVGLCQHKLVSQGQSQQNVFEITDITNYFLKKTVKLQNVLSKTQPVVQNIRSNEGKKISCSISLILASRQHKPSSVKVKDESSIMSLSSRITANASSFSGPTSPMSGDHNLKRVQLSWPLPPVVSLTNTFFLKYSVDTQFCQKSQFDHADLWKHLM